MPNLLTPARIALVLLNLMLLSTVIAAWGVTIVRLCRGQRVLPNGQPTLVPWRGKEVLSVLIVFMATMLVVPYLYMYAVRMMDPDAHANSFDRVVATALMNLTFLMIAWKVLQTFSDARLSDLGVEASIAPMEFFRGLFTWPLVAPLIFGINALVLRTVDRPDKHPMQEVLEQNTSLVTWGAMFFSGVLVAPVVEEFLFRGVLLGWLNQIAMGVAKQKQRRNHEFEDLFNELSTDLNGLEPSPQDILEVDVVTNSIDEPIPPRFVRLRLFIVNVFVSAVFAMLHGSVWPSPVPLFFLSLVLGYLFQRTGSLIAPIGLHMIFNSIPTIIVYLTTLAGGMDSIKQDIEALKAPKTPPAVAKPLEKAPNVEK
jgi:membrane protease YdiL (CAAX protease family)